MSYQTSVLGLTRDLGGTPTTDPAVTGRVEHVSELPAMVEGVKDVRTRQTDLVEQPPVESQGERTAESGGQRRVPGGTIRPAARGVGGGDTPRLPAQDADNAVNATPAEREPTGRSDRPDQRPDEQPLPETSDGVSDGDTVGRVGRSTAGVSEGGDTQRRGGTDIGEPDRADAVVDERPGLVRDGEGQGSNLIEFLKTLTGEPPPVLLMHVKQKNGRMGVIHVGKHIKNLLVLSRLMSLFEHFDTETEATAALSEHPAPSV